ncbi:MAG: ABC transporter substrate-binding protein [Gammaproteobacteria bacterium]|nr:ABC transporter substrate-binding protein [Gammaproteobacteria bacterium]
MSVKRRSLQHAAAIGVLSALIACSAAVAAEVDDAIAVIERLHGALIAAAADQSNDVSARFAALEPVILETHDLPYIARLTVRRYWRDWDESQQAAVTAAFGRLSVMTYASRFAEVGAEAFEITGARQDGNRVEVNALIKRDEADDVTLDYVLRSDGAAWRIVNVLADGVSDLALKTAEYGQLLEDGSVEDLLAELDAQTRALAD